MIILSFLLKTKTDHLQADDVIRVWSLFQTSVLYFDFRGTFSKYNRLTCFNLSGTYPARASTGPLPVHHLENWLYMSSLTTRGCKLALSKTAPTWHTPCIKVFKQILALYISCKTVYLVSGSSTSNFKFDLENGKWVRLSFLLFWPKQHFKCSREKTFKIENAGAWD